MNTTPICDYENSDYKTRFWQGQRQFEDQVERVALRAFMPASGKTLIDIGAGFGRLANEYDGYEKIVLFDYSRSLLREAQKQWGDDPRFLFVAGNWYQMPFVSGLFNTMVQIRTIHHAANVPVLFSELARIAHPDGTYILEFANKQNFKARLRYFTNRQDWSPYEENPIEFVSLNYNFHPRWIRRQLTFAGFQLQKQRAVSHFRLSLAKKLIPTQWLVTADTWLQPLGNHIKVSPSIFNLCRHPQTNTPAPSNAFFACPSCQSPLSTPPMNNQIVCSCGKIWQVKDNLYDFKGNES